MELYKNMTVGEMGAQEPTALVVFKELGIDFCCGGKADLYDSLGAKNMSPEQFERALERAKEKSVKAEAKNFLDMEPGELAEYIVASHHAYLWKTLPETHALFLKVLRVHGAHHLELYEVFRLFGTLKTDLEQHLTKEEVLLFPEIGSLSRPDVKKLAGEIEAEHEEAGELLEKMRGTARDYALPPDACMSYTNLYGTLREIEDDLHQHIHLENNILFKS